MAMARQHDNAQEPPASRSSVRRLVVKVGSAVITDKSGVREAALQSICAQVAQLRREGAQVVIVSSGAVACGLDAMGLESLPRTIVDKQAAAAVGQQRLIGAYARALIPVGLMPAQVLLTAEDLADRARFLNARHTLAALLRAAVMPIINENDSVSYEEIQLGDNDRLSAFVAHLVDADLLVMLTTVEGLRESGGAGDIIPVVMPGDTVETHITAAKTPTGYGGMATKVEAARIAVHSGIPAVIAPGAQRDALLRAVRGEPIGTRFVVDDSDAGAKAGEARWNWLVYAAKARGKIVIDAGAVAALRRNVASLLPSGVRSVAGVFHAGDVVEIVDESGAVVARGLSSYGAHDAARIRGLRTPEIAEKLGACYSEELVHRNDMALLDDKNTVNAGAPL